MFTLGRDAMQSKDAAIRQGQQNAAQAIRDATLNANAMTAQEDQNKFLMDQQSRKLSSGMIMEDIKNGLYDPATARKLQQSLVDEADALSSDQYDATQRAEALKKIRDKRLLDSTNRLERPPQPTREDQLKEFLGPNYETYKDQPWVPDGKGGFMVSKEALGQQQKEQELQQNEADRMRPKSAQEYYGDPKNEDKFQKDLNAKMQAMQDEQDLITDPAKRTPVTQESAWAQMQKDYDFRQKALGKPQYGDPTLMPPNPAPSAVQVQNGQS